MDLSAPHTATQSPEGAPLPCTHNKDSSMTRDDSAPPRNSVTKPANSERAHKWPGLVGLRGLAESAIHADSLPVPATWMEATNAQS